MCRRHQSASTQIFSVDSCLVDTQKCANSVNGNVLLRVGQPCKLKSINNSIFYSLVKNTAKLDIRECNLQPVPHKESEGDKFKTCRGKYFFWICLKTGGFNTHYIGLRKYTIICQFQFAHLKPIFLISILLLSSHALFLPITPLRNRLP
jgi:hypothetical protein